MGKINTYSTLVSACKEVSENESTEFVSYIDTALGLAETRLNKALDTQGVKKNSTLTVSAGNRLVDKPSDYRVGFSLIVDTSTGSTVLDKKTDSYLYDYWPVSVSTGEIKYYADYDNSKFIVAGTPTSTYTATLFYQGDLTPITSAAPVNYLTSVAPDTLFYATMSELAAFEKKWSQVNYWEGRYKDAIGSTNNEGKRQRRDDGEQPNNANSGHNTLLEGSK